ncbi:MAG: hypothetical protein R3Y06_01940 [Faecalibacterium sp.]
MKGIKPLIIIVVTFVTVALGVLYFLREDTDRSYVGIYGEDESY